MAAMNAADWIFYILYWINVVAVVFVFAGFVPQLFYYLFFWFPRKHWKESKEYKKMAIIICAKNEEACIYNMVKYLVQDLDYPKDKYRIYVCASNCTDKTAEEARRAGATVFVYDDFDPSHQRVSYPLRYLIQEVLKMDHDSEVFVRFDADNIPSRDFLKQMNNAICGGAKILRAYEASTNLRQNIWTEQSALFTIKDVRCQNNFRQFLNGATTGSGPGLTFTRDVAESIGGWDCMSAIEDVEFSFKRLYDGYKIYFNTDAIVYEDQPSSFNDTFRRLTRLGNAFTKLFFTDGWRMIVKFWKTGNPMYLDLLLQISFYPVSVICFLWFPLYYSVYAILMLIQGAGVPIFQGYFSAVQITNHYADMYGLNFSYWPDALFRSLPQATQLSYLGQAAVFDLLMMAWETILLFCVLCIVQSWLAFFLDRRKLGLDWKLKGLWKGILLSPIFVTVYGLCNVIGVLSNPCWKIAKRNPQATKILTPLPERKKKTHYIVLSGREKRRYDGTAILAAKRKKQKARS